MFLSYYKQKQFNKYKIINNFFYLFKKINYFLYNEIFNGDWAQVPIPNPQSPIPTVL